MPHGYPPGHEEQSEGPRICCGRGTACYAFEHESLSGIFFHHGRKHNRKQQKTGKDLTGYKEFLGMMQKKQKGYRMFEIEEIRAERQDQGSGYGGAAEMRSII